MNHALTYDDDTDFWLEVQRAKHGFTRGLSFGARLPGSLDDGVVPPCELTDAEIDWLWPRYQACSFPPATFAKRFARNDRASLTPRGKNAAITLAYTYRRQIFGKVAVKWGFEHFLAAVREQTRLQAPVPPAHNCKPLSAQRAAGILSILVLTVLCLLPSVLRADAFDAERFLDAVRLVENVQGRPGRHGELGAYQIRAATWRQHMPGVPFAEARQEAPARTCARRHVAWLRSQLRAVGVDDGPLMTALAWNAGLEQTLRGRAPPRAWDHARRVTNLYQTEARP